MNNAMKNHAFYATSLVLLILSAYQSHDIATCSSNAYFSKQAFLIWFDKRTVILWGWGGIIFGQLGWYSNIFYILCPYYIKHKNMPRFIFLIHIALLLNFMMPIPLAHNEAGASPLCLRSYGAGAALWLLSQAFMLAIERKVLQPTKPN